MHDFVTVPGGYKPFPSDMLIHCTLPKCIQICQHCDNCESIQYFDKDNTCMVFLGIGENGPVKVKSGWTYIGMLKSKEWFVCFLFLIFNSFQGLILHPLFKRFIHQNNRLYLFLLWYDTRSIFKRSLTGFEFRVFLLLDLTKADEPSLPYYLPIAGGRMIGFIPFPRVLVLCEM